MNRRRFLQASAALGAAWQRLFAEEGSPLPGNAIPQWIDPLPLLSVAGGPVETIIDDGTQIHLQMAEFYSNVMPSTFVPATKPYIGTRVWGYVAGTGQVARRETYIGPAIIATRGNPTEIRFTNNLGWSADSKLEAWKDAVDPTLDWANPTGVDSSVPVPSFPIPAVPHLHGGEIPPLLDGGPDAWFTPAGQHGPSYYTKPNAAAAANEVVFKYPNTQEAAPIWFHDHAMGITRLNVYAGLAGAYIIREKDPALPAGLHPLGLSQGNGTVDYTIPLVIQDRMFDVNGQLYFPNISDNPEEHPRWSPEFVGDTIVVNGKVWPYLDVEPKRYRFLFLNGSNARTYELFIVNPATRVMGPPMWQIGTDGGYLDSAVKIDPNASKGQLQVLRLMPGERAEMIIDFTKFAGQTLILRNNARTPYTKGTPATGRVGEIIQFRCRSAAATATSAYNPEVDPSLRPSGKKIVRLPGAPGGGAIPLATKIRQLTLNEVMGTDGPLEVLVNNTRYNGIRQDGSIRSDFTPVVKSPDMTQYVSELPAEGETEIWEIVNLTADAHPIHFHLTQVQIINRQSFNMTKYNAVYAAAFPGYSAGRGMTSPAGTYIPGWGPPLNYLIEGARSLGGNPDITPFLQGPAIPPPPNEQGWKDTIIMFSGEVTRVVIRYAPTDLPVSSTQLQFPFDPNAGQHHGYVFHCHIIDHEDNEMMRPLLVKPKPGVFRSVIDY